MRIAFLVVASTLAVSAAWAQQPDASSEPAAGEELERLTADDHFKRGTAALEAGQVDPALRHLAEAVRLEPDLREGWYNLALAYGRKGDVEQEILAYRKALGIDDTYAKAHYNLGIALEEAGRLADAAKSYARAAVLDDEAYDARMNHGVVLALLGRVDEAIDAYRGALDVNERVPNIHYNLGIALARRAERIDEATNAAARKKAFGEALAAYAAAIRLEPRFAKAEYNRALVLHVLGRTEEEITAFKRAVELQPRYPQALYNLAYTYELARRYTEALFYWRGYLRVARDFPTEAPYLPAAEKSVQRLQAVVQAAPQPDEEEGL